MKKKILITGSSQGIGFAIAERLVKNKENFVYINGRNKSKLIKAKKKLNNCDIAFGNVNKNKTLNKISKKN